MKNIKNKSSSLAKAAVAATTTIAAIATIAVLVPSAFLTGIPIASALSFQDQDADIENFEGGVSEPAPEVPELPDSQKDAIADRLEAQADILEEQGLTEQAEVLRERAAEIRGDDGEVCICLPPQDGEVVLEGGALGPDVL